MYISEVGSTRRRSEGAGRFVESTAELKRGDVVFAEEPYAWVTLPEAGYVCEMCCESDINPVP